MHPGHPQYSPTESRINRRPEHSNNQRQHDFRGSNASGNWYQNNDRGRNNYDGARYNPKKYYNKNHYNSNSRRQYKAINRQKHCYDGNSSRNRKWWRNKNQRHESRNDRRRVPSDESDDEQWYSYQHHGRRNEATNENPNTQETIVNEQRGRTERDTGRTENNGLVQQTPNIKKGTDKSYCFTKNSTDYECCLCKYRGEDIVTHYKHNHPHSEIFISKLDSDIAETAINQSRAFNIEFLVKEQKRVLYGCRFCNINIRKSKHSPKTSTLENFFTHVVKKHTGEYKMSCPECGPQCKQIDLDIPEPPKENDNQLIGYICEDCNFTQISPKNLSAHITRHRKKDTKIIKIDLALTTNIKLKKIADLLSSTAPISTNDEPSTSSQLLELSNARNIESDEESYDESCQVIEEPLLENSLQDIKDRPRNEQAAPVQHNSLPHSSKYIPHDRENSCENAQQQREKKTSHSSNNVKEAPVKQLSVIATNIKHTKLVKVDATASKENPVREAERSITLENTVKNCEPPVPQRETPAVEHTSAKASSKRKLSSESGSNEVLPTFGTKNSPYPQHVEEITMSVEAESIHSNHSKTGRNINQYNMEECLLAQHETPTISAYPGTSQGSEVVEAKRRRTNSFSSSTETISQAQKFQYPKSIPVDRRFKCGANSCFYHADNEDVFKLHWSTCHFRADSFRCAHCSEDLSNHLDGRPSDIHIILKHFQMHDSTLYACSECNFYDYSKRRVERHLANCSSEAKIKVVRDEVEG